MAMLQTRQLATILLTIFFVSNIFINGLEHLNDNLNRFKRGILTFPPNSLVQVTVGLNLVGAAKSNTLGIVLGLQQNAKLPTHTQPLFFPDIFLAKQFSIYDHLKELIARHGFEGSECLKKMICEIAAIPFTGGVLEEVINFVLSPSKHGYTEANRNNSSVIYSSDILLLQESEKFGKQGKNCSNLYKYCERSPLDLISHFIFKKS